LVQSPGELGFFVFSTALLNVYFAFTTLSSNYRVVYYNNEQDHFCQKSLF